MRFFIILLLISFQSLSQSLRLYIIPPPRELNWKNPHTLLRSLTINYFKKNHYPHEIRAMGHIMVQLTYKNDSLITGMVPANKTNGINAIFKEKQGLGVLFSEFEGKLETNESVRNELNQRFKDGSMSFLHFELDTTTFYHLKSYLDEYKAHGYDRIYNGLNLPRHGKGSGCSAFGVSFLELINAFDFLENENWLIDRPISHELIGNATEDNKVGLLKVLLRFKWVKEEDELHKHIVLYDPWKMNEWVLNHYDQPNEMFISQKIEEVKGLVFHCYLNCKPQFPIFYNEE